MLIIDLNISSMQDPLFDFPKARDIFAQGLTLHFPVIDYVYNTESVQPHQFSHQPTLYSAGCQINGTLNCTATCQDPALVFENPYNIQNCMVLALLGPIVLDANGSLSLQNQTLNLQSVAAAATFSINLMDPGFSRVMEVVNSIIFKCLHRF